MLWTKGFHWTIGGEGDLVQKWFGVWGFLASKGCPWINRSFIFRCELKNQSHLQSSRGRRFFSLQFNLTSRGLRIINYRFNSIRSSCISCRFNRNSSSRSSGKGCFSCYSCWIRNNRIFTINSCFSQGSKCYSRSGNLAFIVFFYS